MTTNKTNGKMGAQELNDSAKTARSVTWETWEFTIIGSRQVKVTNASYGYLKKITAML